MNIKLLNINLGPTIESAKKVDSSPRMQNASEDRDADGRREKPAQPEKNQLDDQEFDDALKALALTPGLKTNNLEIKVEYDGPQRIVSIVAPDGMIVRRLTESQLWAATRDKDRATGNMIDRKI